MQKPASRLHQKFFIGIKLKPVEDYASRVFRSASYQTWIIHSLGQGAINGAVLEIVQKKRERLWNTVSQESAFSVSLHPGYLEFLKYRKCWKLLHCYYRVMYCFDNYLSKMFHSKHETAWTSISWHEAFCNAVEVCFFTRSVKIKLRDCLSCDCLYFLSALGG